MHATYPFECMFLYMNEIYREQLQGYMMHLMTMISSDHTLGMCMLCSCLVLFILCVHVYVLYVLAHTLVHACFCKWKHIHFSYRSKDEHNQKVKRRLSEEISLSKENVYSCLLIES